MEFFVGLSYYLYYFTSDYTLKSCGHKSFQNVLWSHDSGHVVHLLKFPHYLYLDPIMHLDVVNQIFNCTGNYFLLGALITHTSDSSPMKQRLNTFKICSTILHLFKVILGGAQVDFLANCLLRKP